MTGGAWPTAGPWGNLGVVSRAGGGRSRRAARRRGQRPTHSPDGVDLTLIRWMLSLTPEERIRVLEDNIHALSRPRSWAAAFGRAGVPWVS